MKAIYNYTKLLSEEKKRSNILATENALKKKKNPKGNFNTPNWIPLNKHWSIWKITFNQKFKN